MTLIKAFAAAFTCATLLSCATEPVVTNHDAKTGVITVCGSRQASNEELMQRAVKACTTSTPKVLRCTPEMKYSTVGTEGAVTSTGTCCDYECPVALGQ